MKKKLKDLSQNELTELRDLSGRIDTLIKKDFIHVQDYLPANIITSLDFFGEALQQEFERREDEY